MPEAEIETGSPLKSFIENTRAQIESGLGEWELKAPVNLELSAIVKGNVGGGIDIKIVNFGTKVEAEQIQKIRVSIGPKDQANEALKKATIAEAGRRERAANHPLVVI